MKRALLLITFLLTAFSGFAQADLLVTVTDNKTIYAPGTDVVYTITVLNYGQMSPTACVSLLQSLLGF
ncbi:hypothetical protein [Flavobacterium sp. 3HN19-14]|uniref:hypothetical protein n=1 Tax=Flavobacterium sp. 3HN19-14 TaxID=3448133 RepID=UPI003EE1F2D4